ncbi:MAG: hypothetical protein IT348_11150 [Candidatus Eisenbacteria bacterium]|nr:hypothetical protein [Candidatus Eisenbacteria bacterium]
MRHASAATPFPLLAVRALRAREGKLADLWSTTSSDLSQLDRVLTRMQNRLRWRRRYQHRCTVIAAAIRGVERVLTGPSREKTSDGWLFFGRREDGSRVLAAALHSPAPRTFADFTNAPEVRVYDARLVDPVELREQFRRIGARVA